MYLETLSGFGLLGAPMAGGTISFIPKDLRFPETPDSAGYP